MQVFWTFCLCLFALAPFLGLSSVILNQNDSSESDMELIFLVELFRHGTRTPLTNFMNDSWINSLGMGTLTATGMREHFILGLQLRERYKDFLPEAYNASMMYVYSSADDRCIQSAMAQLYGLFYMGGPNLPEGYNSSTNYTWPPINVTVNLDFLSDSALPFKFMDIAIHSNDKERDLILETDSTCPEVSKKIENSMSSSEYQALYEELKPILEDYADSFDYYKYFNTTDITIDETHNLVDYVNCQLWNDQVPIVGYPSDLYIKGQYVLALNQYYPFKDPYDSNVFATGMLKFFLSYLEEKTKNPDSPLKLAMLSGHDTNIANILASFNLTNFTCIHDYFVNKKPFDEDCLGVPPYASTAFFELYRNTSSKSSFFVKFRVNDAEYLLCDESESPGDNLCPWETIYTLLNSSIVYDFDNVCHDYIYQYKMTGVKPYKVAVGIALILEVVTIVGVVIVVAKCLMYRFNTKKLQKVSQV